MNGEILKSFKDSLVESKNSYELRVSTQSAYKIPLCKSAKGNKRLSIILPKLINLVLKDSINLKFCDFKNSLLSSLKIYFETFESKVMI